MFILAGFVFLTSLRVGAIAHFLGVTVRTCRHVRGVDLGATTLERPFRVGSFVEAHGREGLAVVKS